MNFCYNCFLQAVGQLGDANEVLNERAVAVMARMKYKLTGRDFSPASASAGNLMNSSVLADRTALSADHDSETGLSVSVQVQKLIDQAMSHENLCQCYTPSPLNDVINESVFSNRNFASRIINFVSRII